MKSSINNISKLAAESNASRVTLYKCKEIVSAHLDQLEMDDQFINQKDFISTMIVSLHIICKASFDDIQLWLESVFGLKTSDGNIRNNIAQATSRAKKINHRYRFDNVTCISPDEKYHRGSPVLTVVDNDSLFCLSMNRYDSCTGDHWGCEFLDLANRGLDPIISVMDGGTGLASGLKQAMPECTIAYDHFHCIRDIYRLCRKISDPTVEKEVKLALGWMFRDVMKFESMPVSDRYDLYDFICSTISTHDDPSCEKIAKFLTSNKDILISALQLFEIELVELSKLDGMPSIDKLWDIVYVLKYPRTYDKHHMLAQVIEDEIDNYDYVEQTVEKLIRKSHRSSSLIENFNSRVAPFIKNKSNFNNSTLELYMFVLNHRPFKRTYYEDRKGMSPANLLTGDMHLPILEMLGYKTFHNLKIA